jgi:hypothetical protein
LPAPRAMRADMHGWPRRGRTASSTKLPEAGPALALPPAADDRLAGVFWPQPLSLGPAGSRAFETHPPCCFGRMSLPGQFKLCTACPAQLPARRKFARNKTKRQKLSWHEWQPNGATRERAAIRAVKSTGTATSQFAVIWGTATSQFAVI